MSGDQQHPSGRTAQQPQPGRFRAAAISLGGSYVGSGITLVKGIVLVPLYLRALGIDIYGAFLASANVVGLLGVVDFGVSAVLQQRLAGEWGANDRERFARSTAAGLAAVAALVSLLVIAAAVVAPYVPRLVRAPTDVHHALSLAFILTAMGSAQNLAMTNVLSVASAWQRSEVGAAARLAGQIADLLAIIVGLALGAGVVALGLGAAVGGAVGLVIALVWTAVLWRRLGLKWASASYSEFAKLARATAPIMLSRLAMQVGSNVEVALISAFITPAVAGVYSITERVFRVGIGFINPIAGSTIAALSHFVGQHGARAGLAPTREIMALWSLGVAALVPAMLALNHDFTTVWVGTSNFGGFALNLFLGSAALLGAAEFLLCVLLTAAGELQRMAWISTLEILARLALMYPALRVFGVWGIPAASCVLSVCFLPLYRRGQILSSRKSDGDAPRFLGASGASVAVAFGLGVVEAAVLPSVSAWPAFIGKAALVGVVNLVVALALNPLGRAVLAKRMGVGRIGP